VSATEGRGLELIEELEASFYAEGVLKNAFFDMQFNFIKRSETVDDLLAWNTDVRKQLDKDVIEFLNVMPILRKNGLPNSRGIILSGPPGTGKTMIAKSLAAKSNVTTILISAEMINQKNEVKSIFRLGRKLAPTLMIIEDIDTAGTVSRRFTDHPILGEYLQAMDGMEPNNGMVIIATTNHTENIDPAISDRPGRFDRIIDVPLPNFAQRIGIISNILGKMPTEEISESEISKVANSSSGLSGAWIREIVQTAMIEAIYAGREKVSAADLELGLNDVLARRGLAYQSTPNLSSEIKSKNAEVYTH
jgi:ATP-dependent 26S proteasome regulatory subunit